MDYELMMNGNVKIGQKAPEFDAITSCGPISLNDYKGKWLILFSHPRRLHPCLHNRDDCFCQSLYIFSANEY